jgi:hypothetical protein
MTLKVLAENPWVRRIGLFLGAMALGALTLRACAPEPRRLEQRTTQETKKHVETHETTATKEHVAALERENRLMKQALSSHTTHQAKKRTTITERVERSAAPPPAHAVRMASGEPSSVPMAPAPYEIRTKTTVIDDDGTTISDKHVDTQKSSDLTKSSDATSDQQRTVDKKADDQSKSTTVTKSTGGGDDGGSDEKKRDRGPGRLGIGLNAGANGGPGTVITYDIVQAHGPKVFGLKKFFVAGGVGVEKLGFDTEVTLKKVDVTPYVGIGKGHVSLDLGYRLIHHEPTIGLTYRVGLK